MSNKKGFVFSRKDPAAADKILSVKPKWYYNWNAIQIEGISSSIPFVPMVWSASAITGQDGDVMKSLYSIDSSQPLLGFNEPDNQKQSNMTVSEALDLWKLLESTSRRLGSPATATNASKDGSWFEQFMSANPKVDFIAIHWYAPPNPSSLLNTVDTLHKKYELPIWITEFAVADWNVQSQHTSKYTDVQVAEFMRTVIPQLDARDYVEKYSWKTRTLSDPNMGFSSIFKDDGSLTVLGEYYSTL